MVRGKQKRLFPKSLIRATPDVGQLPFTDAELEFLATGKLPGQDDETKQ
jgi:hypothetical protein